MAVRFTVTTVVGYGVHGGCPTRWITAEMTSLPITKDPNDIDDDGG